MKLDLLFVLHHTWLHIVVMCGVVPDAARRFYFSSA